MRWPLLSLLGVSAAVAALLPLALIARSYDMEHLPYVDRPDDRPTAIAVSVLTEARVLQGNPDNTIRVNSRLNRAEFMTIVMRLMPPDTQLNYFRNCFPDVSGNEWYADSVCRAKALGIVQGNVLPGIPADRWRFEPSRNVQYEEAVKVLVKMYAVPMVEQTGVEWYVPYIEAAASFGLDIDGLVPGDAITRGEMARLTVAFLAFSEGELNALRAAEQGISSSSSSVMSSRRSESSGSSKPRSSARSGSSISAQFDPLTDTTVRAQFALLGEVSPMLAAAEFFSTAEPIDASVITINLPFAVPSVESFLVYDDERRLIGTANQTSVSTRFQLSVPDGRFTIPHKEAVSLYVRARLKPHESGGTSGEDLNIGSIAVTGNGEWSNDEYTRTSSDTFLAFETARAVITDVEGVGSAERAIASGTNQLLAEFRFDARQSDSQADPRVTALSFQIENVGSVALSSVKLRVEGSDTDSSCSVVSSTVTCSSIPASHGSLDDGPKVIRVYGDLSVPSGVTNPSLRLTLNDPGTQSAAGAVTWTDGTTTFTWVPVDAPVARGTLFR